MNFIIETMPSVLSKVNKLLALPNNGREDKIQEFRNNFFGPRRLRFPEQLHMIVSERSLRNDIRWHDVDGKQWFSVHKAGYEKRIMGVFFEQSSIRSFTTALSGYGFTNEPSSRLYPHPRTASQYIAYSHPCFLKGHPELTVNIRKNANRNAGGTPGNVNDATSSSPLQRNNSADSFEHIMNELCNGSSEAEVGAGLAELEDGFQLYIETSINQVAQNEDELLRSSDESFSSDDMSSNLFEVLDG